MVLFLEILVDEFWKIVILYLYISHSSIYREIFLKNIKNWQILTEQFDKIYTAANFFSLKILLLDEYFLLGQNYSEKYQTLMLLYTYIYLRK